MSEVKDTISRLQQILPHMRDQLICLREAATFEEARRRYSANVERLALQGVGRRTASSVGDKDAYWAPTADVLTEAIRLGFVERQQVPSARRYVEAHRDRRYVLTGLGREVAELAQDDLAAFCDRLAEALYNSHPYFRALLSKLEAAPIACPEVTESEVDFRRPRGARHAILGGICSGQTEATRIGRTGHRCGVDQENYRLDSATQVRRRSRSEAHRQGADANDQRCFFGGGLWRARTGDRRDRHRRAQELGLPAPHPRPVEVCTGFRRLQHHLARRRHPERQFRRDPPARPSGL